MNDLVLLCMWVLLLAAPPAFSREEPAGVADLILRGGRIWTGDPARPEAEAVAAVGARVLAVGSSQEIGRFQGSGTRVIELRGRPVVPGFIDAHAHFLDGGDELLAPDLRSARSEEELAERLGQAAARLSPGAWLASGAWDHENWPGARLPRREAVDRRVPGNPRVVKILDRATARRDSSPEVSSPRGIRSRGTIPTGGRHEPRRGRDSSSLFEKIRFLG